ncbi:hypothetical protein TWF718_008071 [Orbilia javanica]|uniref:Uncharacterized protein n=1 Tax=Orbilia javanica TaxID=47235 RepID=A0AAN8MWI7_9PEZI
MSIFYSPPSSPSAPSTFPPLNIPNIQYNLRKRKADIEPTVESPLTKRFRKLNIRNIPSSKVTKRTGSPARNPLSGSNQHSNGTSGATTREPWNLTPPPFQRPSSPPPAVMEVDDTPYRIFVNDLDSSSDDSDQDSPSKNEKNNPIIFLSDVEREMTRIPMAVLKASSSSATLSDPRVTKLTTARASSGSSTDLILYRPPEQIVDDTPVKRMVMEAKQRIRMRNISNSAAMYGIGSEPVPPADIMMDQNMGQFEGAFTGSPMSFIPTMPSNDPDAMVLDDL